MSWLWHWAHENEPGKYNKLDIIRPVASSVFGAIHTTTQVRSLRGPPFPVDPMKLISSTTQVLAHCLFELATRPEYVGLLRHEVQQAFERHGGWTKEAMESMLKLDSFIKECQRFNPLDSGIS